VGLLALRPLLAYCARLGWEWRWLWRSRWNVDWQGNPKFSEKTCPSSTFVHHKIPHDQTRVWTRAAAVGSRRLTVWAMVRPRGVERRSTEMKVPSEQCVYCHPVSSFVVRTVFDRHLTFPTSGGRSVGIVRLRTMATEFFNWYSEGWSPTGSTRHCGHQWPIVPAPGDYHGEIGGMISRINRSTRRKLASVPLCPPQTPHACPDANPGRRGGKPATNSLSYGRA
jgi:hypothetical protein